jgi:uncharacterized protein (UPF0210 family)
MINTELIARAICHCGTCKVCDPDCVDYRAAQRVMKAIEAEPPAELLKAAEELVSKAGVKILSGDISVKSPVVQELTLADLGLLKTINKLEETADD